MEASFSVKLPLQNTFTRGDIVSCEKIVRSAVAAECGRPDNELGFSLHVSTAQGDLRFDSIDELCGSIPPLEPIKSFVLTASMNPFQIRRELPSASVLVRFDPDGPALHIAGSAADTCQAQALVLRIKDALSPLCSFEAHETRIENRRHQQIGKEPKKRPKKTHVPIGTALNSAVDTISKLPSALSVIRRAVAYLIRFLSEI